MRTVTKIPKVERLSRNDVADQALERYLKTEVEDYISGLAQLYTRWQDYIRMYRGIPMERFSRDPIPVQNVEVTIGATAVDTLIAQANDMINNASPIVTVRGASGFEKNADAFQALNNHLVIDPYTNFGPSCKDFDMDCTSLGTGLFYTIWQEEHKQTGLEEIIDWGPRIYCPAPEDIVIPGSATADVQSVRMVGFSRILTHGELILRGTNEGWDFDLAQPTRNLNPVKRQRQVAAHVTDKEHAESDFFEIYEIFVYYPYATQRYDLDLYCVWDRTSARILYLNYNPFNTRPFSVARYQYQSHSFFGLGVMEMLAQYEKEVTDWHNFRMANAKLVGSRAWGVKIGSPMSGFKLRIVPNKPLFFNAPDDIKEFRMADVYPSMLQSEQYIMQMADKRVGTMTDFSSKPSPGHRTPGITALSMLQQINRRFTSSFEELRGARANALYQCNLRMQEKFHDGGESQARIVEWLNYLLGGEKAEKVIDVLRDDQQKLRDKLSIEMTASSQSINREADKQGAMQVLQSLMMYYDKVMQYAAAAANPQIPAPVKRLMIKACEAATEAMDKTLHTFDQIRDTHLYLINQEDFEALANPNEGAGASVSGGNEGMAGPAASPNGADGFAGGMAQGSGRSDVADANDAGDTDELGLQ